MFICLAHFQEVLKTTLIFRVVARKTQMIGML